MTDYLSLSAVTGYCLFAAGFLALWRGMLLTPKQNGTFPCAPLVVRFALWVAGLGGIGVGALFMWHDHQINAWGHIVPYAGRAAMPIAGLAVGAVIYQAILFLNIFRERRPGKVWAAHARVDRRAGLTHSSERDIATSHPRAA